MAKNSPEFDCIRFIFFRSIYSELAPVKLSIRLHLSPTSTGRASFLPFNHANMLNRAAKEVLKKSPNDVVVLSSVRSPIARAYKGGFKDSFPEEMLMPVRRKWT